MSMRAQQQNQKGQAVIEFALLVPILLLLLFGVVQFARVYYTYHTLQKALRGGAGFIAHMNSVNFCDDQNASFLDARNYIVFGNLQGSGSPVVNGLTPEMVQIIPERADADTSSVALCPCSDDGASCDIASAGRAPDYVVVN